MLTDMKDNTTFFAPMIYLKQVAPTIEFYNNASDAIVLGQWNNDDSSVHVAEMSIHGAMFHMHDRGRSCMITTTVKAVLVTLLGVIGLLKRRFGN